MYNPHLKELIWNKDIPPELSSRMNRARELSWNKFGKKISFYLPGMIKYNGKIGKYPAISITGSECALECEHCKGKLLKPMMKANTPEKLIDLCKTLEDMGNIGVLLTGGSNKSGVMPWEKYSLTIRKIKDSTNLKVSIHTGIINRDTALILADSGLDQALIDVIGCDQTLREVYHLDFSIKIIENSLKALFDANITVIPHIVIGLHFGEILGEYSAIKLLSKYKPDTLVFVVMSPLRGTPMENVTPPTPYEIADIICEGRMLLSESILSLGCERSRNKDGYLTEILAIESGINRIAIQSDYAINHAKNRGIDINLRETCCSFGHV